MWTHARVAFAVVGLAFLSAPAYALPPEQCIPLRWPDAWIDAPDSLELLRGTPINCLLISPPAPPAEMNADRRQQLARFTESAHSRGVQVLSVSADIGLDGMLPPSILESKGTTARVQIMKEDGARATASSEPWIDTNLWLVHSLRAARRGPVWLSFDLDHPSLADYLRTIADAAAEGGRWIVSLDAGFAAGLKQKTPESVAAWRSMASYLAFFEAHSDWRDFQSAGTLGVIEDPGAKDADLFNETLNLVTRRRIPYRILLRSSLGPDSLKDLNAVLATGIPDPTVAERATLTRFVERGGLLVAGPAWSAAKPPTGEYSISTAGHGQTVIYADESPDPAALAKHLLSLLGKNRVGIRLFNGPSVLCPARISPDGSRLLVQLINYASEPADAITVRVAGEWRTARIYGPDQAPLDAPLEPTGGSVQIRIPKFHIYSALLFEK